MQLVFAAALVVVAASYWVVQVVHGTYYRELAINNSLRKRVVKAPRGIIYDHKSLPLVENVPSYNLLLHPSRSAGLSESHDFALSVLGATSERMEER